MMWNVQNVADRNIMNRADWHIPCSTWQATPQKPCVTIRSGVQRMQKTKAKRLYITLTNSVLSWALMLTSMSYTDVKELTLNQVWLSVLVNRSFFNEWKRQRDIGALVYSQINGRQLKRTTTLFFHARNQINTFHKGSSWTLKENMFFLQSRHNVILLCIL